MGAPSMVRSSPPVSRIVSIRYTPPRLKLTDSKNWRRERDSDEDDFADQLFAHLVGGTCRPVTNPAPNRDPGRQSLEREARQRLASATIRKSELFHKLHCDRKATFRSPFAMRANAKVRRMDIGIELADATSLPDSSPVATCGLRRGEQVEQQEQMDSSMDAERSTRSVQQLRTRRSARGKPGGQS